MTDVADPRADFAGAVRYLWEHLSHAAQRDNVPMTHDKITGWKWRGKVIDSIRLLWPTLSDDDTRNVSVRLSKALKDSGRLALLSKGGPAQNYQSEWFVSARWGSGDGQRPPARPTFSDGTPGSNGKGKRASKGKGDASAASSTGKADRPRLVRRTIKADCGHSWITSARPASFVICPQCNANGQRVQIKVPA